MIEGLLASAQPISKSSSWNYVAIPITNRLGFHARPCMIAADYLGRCSGNVEAAKSRRLDESPETLEYVDATSIMSLLRLCALVGETLHIRYDFPSPKMDFAISIIQRTIALDDSGLGLEEVLGDYEPQGS